MQLRLLACLIASAALFAATSISAKAQSDVVRTTPAPDTGNTLAPVRADDPLTMNAMLGFINSEPVFVSDLLRPIDEQLREIAKGSRNVTEFREAAKNAIQAQLQNYVSDILKMTNAKAALTEEDKGKLDLYMNLEKSKLISKYGGSEALANQALKAEGSSVDKALKDIRRKVTVELYLNKTLYPKIVVTRQSILEAYEKTPQKWKQGAEIELYTITLPISRWLPKEASAGGRLGAPIAHPTDEQLKQAQAGAMAAAREVIDRLKKGANFAQLVEDYDSHDMARSTGGKTAHLARGSIASQKLEDYAFSLPANTIGPDPLPDGAGGVVIVKVGQKQDARTIPFSEAQKKIEQELRDKQGHQLYQDYMQNLYKSAAIEKVDRMIDVAIDVAVARYATQ